MSQALIRPATRDDLGAIIRLLADDPLGRLRESPGETVSASYLTAFEAISRDPNQLLVVAEDNGEIIGTLQLTYIPGLSRGGAWRGQIEAVRIASGRRGAGLGEVMIGWAIEKCRAAGCRMVQLTTDKQRTDAHRFYDRLGFSASHLGYKLALD